MATYTMSYPVNRKITGEELLYKAIDAQVNGKLSRPIETASNGKLSIDDAILLLHDAGLITLTDW